MVFVGSKVVPHCGHLLPEPGISAVLMPRMMAHLGADRKPETGLRAADLPRARSGARWLGPLPARGLELDVERGPSARQELRAELSLDPEGRPRGGLDAGYEGLHGRALPLDDGHPQPAAVDLDLEGGAAAADRVGADPEGPAALDRGETASDEGAIVPRSLRVCRRRRGRASAGAEGERREPREPAQRA